MVNATLEIQLGVVGLSQHADALAKATGLVEQIAAIREALAGVEGYQLACYRHSRALQHTAASFEREQLAFIEGSLRARLEQLVDRLPPAGKLAAVLQITGRP